MTMRTRTMMAFVVTISLHMPAQDLVMELSNRTLPSVSIIDASPYDCLSTLVKRWNSVSSNNLDVAICERVVPYREENGSKVSIVATNMSFMSAFRLVGELAGKRLFFDCDRLLVTDIEPPACSIRYFVPKALKCAPRVSVEDSFKGYMQMVADCGVKTNGVSLSFDRESGDISICGNTTEAELLYALLIVQKSGLRASALKK